MGVTDHLIRWRGMAISIRHATRRFSDFDHLEIRSVEPERAALPITGTGYRSHFLPAGELEESGGPVAFVTAWLDHAAAEKANGQPEQLSLL